MLHMIKDQKNARYFLTGFISGVGYMLTAVVVIDRHLTKKVEPAKAESELWYQILSDSCKLLMERADDSTLVVLDERLDYWRVLTGMPIDLPGGEK